MSLMRSGKGWPPWSLCWLVRVYLIVFLSGCAGAPPRPEGADLQLLQTRTFAADYNTVFDAAMATVQDLNYTPDLVNGDAGVISASTQTTEALAKITKTKGGRPTWVWALAVALIVVIVVIVIAAALSGDDDDDDEQADSDDTEETDGDKKQKSGKKARRRGTVVVRSDDEENETGRSRRARDVTTPEARDEESGGGQTKVKAGDKDTTPRKWRRTHRWDHRAHYYTHDHGGVNYIYISDNTPEAPEWHQYRITLHFDDPGLYETKVRLSVEGTRLKGDDVKETGPVYDPDFYAAFFDALERNLSLAHPDTGGIEGNN